MTQVPTGQSLPEPLSEPVTGAGDGAMAQTGVMHVVRRGLRMFAGRLTDLVVPPTCQACKIMIGGHDALCAACWSRIDFIGAPLCNRRGIPMPFDPGGGVIISAGALADPPDYDRARAVATFGPVMRDLVHRFKYADQQDARLLFGRWQMAAGRELIADADVIVPIPLHRWRLLTRRFNQAAELGRELARLTGKPFDPLSLARRRATRPQVGLSVAERKRNVQGAFEVPKSRKERIAGRRVLLIDDVITTGSTISAAARVLKRAGATGVDVLALAIVTDDSRMDL